jgi:hypothetical protein
MIKIPSTPDLGLFAFSLVPYSWFGNMRNIDQKNNNEIIDKLIGPHDVPIIVTRGGAIIFDFPESARYKGGFIPSQSLIPGEITPKPVEVALRSRSDIQYNRLKYMNAFQLCLRSSLHEIDHYIPLLQPMLNPENHFRASKIENKIIIETENQNIPIIDYERQLNPKTIDRANEIMNTSFGVYGEFFDELLSLLYLAHIQYNQHQFASAHLISWGVVEYLLNHRWSRHLANATIGGLGSSKARKYNSRSSRNKKHTAFEKSQSLLKIGAIDKYLLESLDLARDRRNKFAHHLDPITDEDADGVVSLATRMISQDIGMPVHHHLSHYGIL